MSRRVLTIMGPTCSGKTDLAIQLSQHRAVHLISVDSALIYKAMDIGSAKPDQTQHPHALVDIIEPHQRYSVAEFLQDVKREIEFAWSQHKLPILVGGTMMYYNALRCGIADIPDCDPEIRAALLAEQQDKGTPSLHAQLQACDPVLFKRLDPNDTQRVMRALEVYRSSGRALSEWQAVKPEPIFDPAVFFHLLLIPVNRHILHQRISERFNAMMDLGFMDEVQHIVTQYPVTPESPSMRSVGYRQAWAYLRGEISETELREQAIAATRQLAKRQLTWLRSWPEGICFDIDSPYQQSALDLLKKI